MLNEGYHLYKSLERCGISLTRRHPDVKEPGKKDGLIVGLDKTGKVTRLEFRKRDDIAKLWTTAEGNQNSFPVIKLQRPLWEADQNDPMRKKLAGIKNDEPKKKKLLLQQNRELNLTNTEADWWKRLHARVKKLRPLYEEASELYRSLPQLMDRFLEATDIEDFLQSFFKELKRSQDDVPYPLLENIVIGSKWDSKKREFRAEVPLVLDLSDWEKYSTRVASPKMECFVSECLLKTESASKKSKRQNGTKEGDRISALSGETMQLEDDKFPNPKLPVLGNVYLFSVNDQTPCQTRYSKTSTDIFPVGRKEANAIQDGLIWITDEERYEKTWYPVPGLKDGESNLLIAYLEDKPNLNVNQARLLGGVSSANMSEARFEEAAAPVIRAYRGERIIKANDKVRFFTLRQADPGRKQIVLHRNCTVADIVEAAEAWQEAGKNVPPFTLLFPGKKGEKGKVLSPRCPFPADLVRLSQKQWLRRGERFSSVPGIFLGDLYDVFFDRENKKMRTVEILLEITLRRTVPLLVGIGEALHKDEIKEFSSDARFSALLAVSAFSIYLHKVGIRKENYMKSNFFYVGRFLSLVDTLHLEYCKYIRKGNIPPQLLGNAHLSLALENPTSALARLSQRIGVYQAWTRKEQDENVRLARWAVGEIGKVTAELADKELSSSTTDAEKAQILLGYLAMPRKSTPDDSNNSPNLN
jgi:hypothetical protein